MIGTECNCKAKLDMYKKYDCCGDVGPSGWAIFTVTLQVTSTSHTTKWLKT